MNQNQLGLEQQLRQFRQKFYTDRIIRGSLILALLVSSIIFIALLGESLFSFSSGVRKGIFFGFGLVSLVTLLYMVAWPAAQLFRMARNISDMQIAGMVKKHFPNINDKLINLLQLRDEYREENNVLAEAAVDQKAEDIAPVPISRAVDFNLNRRYLLLLLIPFFFFGATYLLDKDLLGVSALHLFNYEKEYPKELPFYISLTDLPEKIVAGQSYDLKVTVEGEELPEDLFIYMKKNGETQHLDYSLDKNSNTKFSYTISNVKDDFSFYVGNPAVPDANTKELAVKVLKRPYIKQFNVYINYPNYTGLASEKLEDNVGDLKALRGSVITWELESQGEVDEAQFVAGTKSSFKFDEKKDRFRLSKKLMQDLNYFISLSSPDKISNIDTVQYHAQVTSDRYPSIYVFSPKEEFLVDIDPQMPLELEIADDFGFSKMGLYYRFTKSGGSSEVTQDFKEHKLNIEKRRLLQPRDYLIDLTELGLREGDELEYYIRVWDNDGISGPKASTSATFKVIYPTLDAKYEEMGEKKKNFKEKLNESRKKAEKMKDAYKKMQQKMLDKKNLSFDDKKEIQQMVEEHQQLMQSAEQLKEQLEEMKNEMENNQMISEETLEKYERLTEMLDNVKNPEIEKMLEELKEKMDELNPEDIMEKMDELQMNDEEIEKSLERTMELLKQLEVQDKIDEIRNKLDKLEQKQEMLNEKTDNTDMKKEDGEMDKLQDMQEELNDQMDDIKEDVDDLAKMKEETDTPDKEKMDEIKEKGDEAKEDMESASEEMEKSSSEAGDGKNQKAKKSKSSASDSQKDAKKKMEEMSDALSEMQMEMEMDQMEQNMQSLRELLENLIKLSFDQEDLRDDVKKLRYGDPSLKQKGQDQKKLRDDMGLVKDSLEALANRVFQIQEKVLAETKIITKSMKKSQVYFRNKQINQLTYHQQTAMTSINNLANMLSETLKQMQAEMKGAMPGGGMCNKPGGSKPMDMEGMGNMQKKLNQMMKQMKGSGGMTPSALAKMAAMQQKIREMLQKGMKQNEQSGGAPLGDMGKVMKDMEETEQELLNSKLTAETMKRQKDILTRMLQADKSIRERDWDEKRESRTANVDERKSPEELTKEEYKNRIRQELLKSNQLEYSSDFIKLIEQYYQKID